MIKLSKILTEAKVNPLGFNREFSPEKIDEFVVQASKEANTGSRILESYINKVALLTVSDILEDQEKINSLITQIEEVQKQYFKLYNRYFNIVDLYDYLEAPDNVKMLEKRKDELDEIQMNLDDVKEALEILVEAATKIKRISL